VTAPPAIPGHAPILVLGLGNILLGDDGAGRATLERVAAALERVGLDDRIELLDGGTQGLGLLAAVANRRALLILDAVALGARPGTVHVLDGAAAVPVTGGLTAHESSASELLAALALLGERPQHVVVIGIEPAELVTRMGLSAGVEAAVPAAASRALRVLDSMTKSLRAEVASCTR